MYARILVPLDGSKFAEKAIPHAQGLAKASGATVYLVQVVPRRTNGALGAEAGLNPELTVELARQIEEAQMEAAQKYIAQVSSQLESEGVHVETDLMEGAAYEHIIDYAKQHGIDLITMCTHGRGGVRRMLLGSVTDRVIRAGDVPVLVVPS